MDSQFFVEQLQIQREAQYQFVVIELELAITYGEAALNTNESDRFHRNSRLAQLAYGTAIRFLTSLNLDFSMQQNIGDALQKVRRKFQALERKQYEY